MARIPQHFIDELLSRTDIIELVNRHVPLKKAGRDYMACCPFHNEKSPSFSVSPTKQFFHCFGCGAHGTALSFLMQHQRMEFREAVEELARNAGMEIPEEVRANEPADASAPLYQLNAQAQQLFRDALRNHPHAVEYLKKRGLSRESVNHFGIGYAPSGWSHLLERLGDPVQLERAGLVIRREGESGGSGKYYDRFRDRIMFPIRDGRGRILGFGGRTLGDDKPKYLNSPESPIFHKGRQLYGAFELRQSVARPARVLVVEGYMDAVMLAQQGVPEVLATLGTATTEEHLQLLYRLSNEIVFAFDGDKAGYTAASRALERAIPHIKDGVALKFLFLPEGEDPDSLIQREGREAFLHRLQDALPLSAYLLTEITEGLDLRHVDGRAQAVARARVHIQRMPAGAFRSLFLQQLAEQVKLPRVELERVLGGAVLPAEPVAGPVLAPALAPRDVRPTPVRRALQWLLELPELAQSVNEPAQTELRSLTLPGVDLLLEVIGQLRNHPQLNAASLLTRFEGRPEEAHLRRLMQTPLVAEAEGAREFTDCIQRLRHEARSQRLDQLLGQSSRSGLNAAEKAELNQLLRQQSKVGGKA